MDDLRPMAPFKHKSLRMPKQYVLSSIIVSFGGLLFGLDTGIIGPVTSMDQFIDQNGSFGAVIHGLIVSCILIPAALTSFLAGPLAERIGRTYGIMSGACVFAIGTAVEAAAQELGMFIAGRIVVGIGEGLFLSTIVVYICEIVPASKRGPLASLCQMGTVSGLVIGYFTCYGSTRIPSSMAWRIPFIVQSLVAVILAIACPFLPPSPRYLLSRQRQDEIPAVLERLGLDPVEFANDTRKLVQASRVTQRKSTLAPLKAVIRPQARWQALFAIFLMSMTQFAGIDGVLYYAPVLFAQAGLTAQTASFLASGVSALVIFFVTIPAVIFADRFPRRLVTLIGALGMTICMFLIGGIYAFFSDSRHSSTDIQSSPARWAIIIVIFVYAGLYSGTWAVVLRVYISEIQPSETRAAASALAQSANWIANFVVALSTPVFLARSSFGAYFLWGGCAGLTGVVCFFFMPETRGVPLDDVGFFREKGRKAVGNGDVEDSACRNAAAD